MSSKHRLCNKLLQQVIRHLHGLHSVPRWARIDIHSPTVSLAISAYASVPIRVSISRLLLRCIVELGLESKVVGLRSRALLIQLSARPSTPRWPFVLRERVGMGRCRLCRRGRHVGDVCLGVAMKKARMVDVEREGRGGRAGDRRRRAQFHNRIT